nr:uncharacterized protein LOC109180802 isoform X1 [Ipomoea batatas]
MMSLRIFMNITPLSSSSHSATRIPSNKTPHITGYAPIVQEASVGSVDSQSQLKQQMDKRPPGTGKPGGAWDSALGNEGPGGVSGVQVPRQRHITASKSQLLDAILSAMFDSEDESKQFRDLCSCLDLILHAEHKSILEEMRDDYDLAHVKTGRGNSFEGTSSLDGSIGPNGRESDAVMSNSQKIDKYDGATGSSELLISSSQDILGFPSISFLEYINKINVGGSRVDVPSSFQRSFIRLLSDAGFEELSPRDLMLSYALNTDYLLTLPISVDWKRASESSTIIFRRGYTTERQKGILAVEKLEYLQSKLLQGLFFIIVKPLGKTSIWLTEVLKRNSSPHDAQNWAEKFKLWLEELPYFQQTYSYDKHTSSEPEGLDHLLESDLPIWKAAQRAATHYEEILSAAGPRGRLLRKFLTSIGLLPSTPQQEFELHVDNTDPSEPHLRPVFLPRISLGDIWAPASTRSCGNDIWKMFRTAVSILLSQSTLQEPAFEELILLYTKETCQGNTGDEVEFPSLQLKFYETIPIPDLPVVFPHKKLSFRILDSVRLDIASILGLLAYFINYKFEDILSSPSAILLDVIALSALVIYVTRVVLGYKQTWDRYQLLVNRTLNEKTIASGFGSIHFLLDASEQQQYKQAILAYAILLKIENDKEPSARTVGVECSRFMYNVFKEKVDLPIGKAVKTLVRLGIVVAENSVDGDEVLRAIPCLRAREILKQRWNSLVR